jgi:hypothetical protein
LPLVACLLALPQKDLLQGLTNLTSCNVSNTALTFKFITRVKLNIQEVDLIIGQ